MSDTRGSTNGNSGGDNYSTSNMGVSVQSGYAAPALNGSAPSNKRMRDEDDQDQTSRPSSRSDDIDGMKRRKTVGDGSVSGPVGGAFDRDVGRPINRTRSTIVQRRR